MPVAAGKWGEIHFVLNSGVWCTGMGRELGCPGSRSGRSAWLREAGAAWQGRGEAKTPPYRGCAAAAAGRDRVRVSSQTPGCPSSGGWVSPGPTSNPRRGTGLPPQQRMPTLAPRVRPAPLPSATGPRKVGLPGEGRTDWHQFTAGIIQINTLGEAKSLQSRDAFSEKGSHLYFYASFSPLKYYLKDPVLKDAQREKVSTQILEQCYN